MKDNTRHWTWEEGETEEEYVTKGEKVCEK